MARGTGAYDRGRLWIENQDPASRKGATIGWVRRYQAADGQLYAVLLSAYFFLTVLPLLLVYSSYLYHDPHALAMRLETRLSLGGQTAKLLDTVLAGASGHQLSAFLIAVIDLFFFGLGFGRVLQLAHARSWGLDLRKSVVADQVRYLEVLGAIALLLLVFVVQTRELRGSGAWIGWVWTSDGLRFSWASSSRRRNCCCTAASRGATSCPAPCSRLSASSCCGSSRGCCSSTGSSGTRRPTAPSGS
jgi:hypothetical protein